MNNKEKLFDQIRTGNFEAVRDLLENNPNLLEIRDQRGSTPLLLAAYYGHENIVTLLLDKGARVDALDGSGNTALMGVCFKGFTGIAEKLIKAGANVSQKNARKGCHPLLIFLRLGRRAWSAQEFLPYSR